jgi:fatty-acid desaturase
MIQLDTQREQSLQRIFRIVSIVTVVFSFIIRVLTPGWMLVVFCIPIIIVLLIHLMIQFLGDQEYPAEETSLCLSDSHIKPVFVPRACPANRRWG